jgi:transcriptional regulator with XRE-family HTH domain
MSQAEIARKIGMKQQNWNRYESGEQMPGAEQLHRISVGLGVSADWLLGIEKNGRTEDMFSGLLATKDDPQAKRPANAPRDQDMFATIKLQSETINSLQETIARLLGRK